MPTEQEAALRLEQLKKQGLVPTEQAREIAYYVHGDETVFPGSPRPYRDHLNCMEGILSSLPSEGPLRVAEVCMSSSWLHGTISRKYLSYSFLTDHFGEEIAHLVMLVTRNPEIKILRNIPCTENALALTYADCYDALTHPYATIPPAIRANILLEYGLHFLPTFAELDLNLAVQLAETAVRNLQANQSDDFKRFLRKIGSNPQKKKDQKK